jgi:hypothetical protein
MKILGADLDAFQTFPLQGYLVKKIVRIAFINYQEIF